MKKITKTSPINWVKKYKKRLIALAIIALIGIFVYRRATATPKDMESMTVSTGSIESFVSANGTIDAKMKADLKFNLPGKLVWLGVKEGDTVRAYQSVASLDRRLLEKSLATNLSLYMTQRMDFDTTQKETFKGEVVTDEVQRALNKSQYALDRSVLTVEASDIAKREAVLITPIAGTVISTNDLVPGINLSGADLEKKTVRVVDLKTLYFNAQVDEADYSKVKTGLEAEVEIDSFPGAPCTGTVKTVGHEGEKSTGGVITIPAEITFTSCPHTLAVGLNGEARIILSRAADVITLPKKYLITRNGETYVLVQTGDSFRKREERKVKTGITSPYYC